MSELLMCCRCKQAKGFDIYRVTRMGELAMALTMAMAKMTAVVEYG